MSRYQLVDGTYSDQYKVGDKFVTQDDAVFAKGTIVVYFRDVRNVYAWFIKEGDNQYNDRACNWQRLLAYVEDTSPTHAEIEELEAKIETLEEYISELVHQNGQQKKVLDNFAQLTKLVSTHSHIAEALNAKIGDDVVERLVQFLSYDLDSLKQQAGTYIQLNNKLSSHQSFIEINGSSRCHELLSTVDSLQFTYDIFAKRLFKI